MSLQTISSNSVRSVSLEGRSEFRFGFSALVILFFALGPAPLCADSVEPLKNADIVALVEKGLSEAAILAHIQASATDFDTSTDALLRLAEAGVGNSIIEAMLAATEDQGQSPALLSSLPSDLPTAYGLYAYDGNGLTELSLSTVKATGISGAGRKYLIDGLAGEPPHNLSPDIQGFIIHEQWVIAGTIRLGRLDYVRSMKAHEFVADGTSPRFFPTIYGRNYDDVIPVDLWRPRTELPLKVEPVPERENMYRLVPANALDGGRYSLYTTDTLHIAPFMALTMPETAVLYFEIGGSKSSDAADPEPSGPDSLTASWPMDDYFLEATDTFEADSETLWAAVRSVFVKKKAHLAQADPTSGTFVTREKLYFIMLDSYYMTFAGSIESIAADRTRLSVKGFAWVDGEHRSPADPGMASALLLKWVRKALGT